MKIYLRFLPRFLLKFLTADTIRRWFWNVSQSFYWIYAGLFFLIFFRNTFCIFQELYLIFLMEFFRVFFFRDFPRLFLVVSGRISYLILIYYFYRFSRNHSQSSSRIPYRKLSRLDALFGISSCSRSSHMAFSRRFEMFSGITSKMHCKKLTKKYQKAYRLNLAINFTKPVGEISREIWKKKRKELWKSQSEIAEETTG